MKTIGKKTLAWLLGVLLMAGCCLTAGLPRTAVSAETVDSGSCGDSVTWALEDSTLTISGEGEMENYLYYNSAPWDSYCTQIESVVIQEGVTSVGGFAFAGCTSLAEVSLPDSLTSIRYYAFAGCTSLAEVTLPDSVATIEYFAFSGCTSLAEITLPESITSIGDYAFNGCTSLAEITIPDSVTSIGNSFYGCTGLTKVTIPDTVTSIGTYAFTGCDNLTIYGYAGSAAETYANENDISFVDITLPFTDVQDHSTYFYKAVQYVYSLGLMTGLDSTTFGPGESLSRAQFATILYRMAGSPSVEGMSNLFEDNQSSDTFFYSAVIWCNNAGIITGYYNADGSFSGQFGPSDSITREQLATMLFRYANYAGEDTSARISLDSFGDADSVSSFAVEALQWAAAEGIVSGRDTTPPTIAPQDSASRADAAVMLQRYLE